MNVLVIVLVRENECSALLEGSWEDKPNNMRSQSTRHNERKIRENKSDLVFLSLNDSRRKA
jgi:hypothetical protein